MENLLDKFFMIMDRKLKKKFPQCIIKVSKMKGSFYVLVRKPHRKIIGDECKNLYEDIKILLEGIYDRYSKK